MILSLVVRNAGIVHIWRLRYHTVSAPGETINTKIFQKYNQYIDKMYFGQRSVLKGIHEFYSALNVKKHKTLKNRQYITGVLRPYFVNTGDENIF